VIEPQAEPIDVAGTASRGLMAVVNSAEPGLLRVVIYGPMPIDKDGVLLNLRFRTIGTPDSMSVLTMEQVIVNEGEFSVATSIGRVAIVSELARAEK